MTTIKDAPIVELLIGTEKFPISNGSGEPVTATINLILEKVPEPDLSEYATKEEIPIKVSQLENDVPYALKSEVEVEVENQLSNVYTKSEIDAMIISTLNTAV